MLQVNYTHLPASLRCRRGQPSPCIRAPRKDVGRSPGRGPPTLRRPPPVNQEENQRRGCLLYSHPSTSVLNARATREGNTVWFQRGLGRASEHPCPWCPRCRGQSLPLLELSVASPPTLSGPWSYVRVCWRPGESGPRHWGQKWSSCFRPQTGFCLGSSEHGETTPSNGETHCPRCSPPRTT